MKKLFTFVMCLLLVGAAQAQLGLDVTDKYLVNAGFDEDISTDADGKNAKPDAEDGTYWKMNGTQVQAVFAQIMGWTLIPPTTQTWTTSLSVPYDHNPGASYAAPERPIEANTDENVGVLRLSAGWGSTTGYRQEAKIPAGRFRLTYYIWNKNGKTLGTNKFHVVCGEDSIVDSESWQTKAWTKRSFDLVSDGVTPLKIQFAFTSNGSKGSGDHPVFFIDEIHLYQLDGVSEADMLLDAIKTLKKQVLALCGTLEENFYEGLYDELKQAYNVANAVTEKEDVAVLQATYDALNEAFLRTSSAVALIPTINSLLQKMNNLLQTTNYPAHDALQDTYEQYADITETGNADQITQAVATLKQAIHDYQVSQTGSEDSPANFTFFIQHPWFVNESAEPTIDADGNYVFPNVDKYKVGSSPVDANSGGWYIGPSGGDQRTNYAGGNYPRPCWNAWNLNFNTVSINQNLTDLPNGYYKLQGDLYAQPGCVTDQHVYAKSVMGSSTSSLVITDSEWNTCTTDEKVLVIDGKLTIGAEGTGDKEHTPQDFGGSNTDKRRGWFLATNFRLLYLGQASEEEIAAVYQKKVDEANALVETMHLAGDREAFRKAIAQWGQATETTSIYASIDSLVKAQNTAVASEAKYNEVMAAGKTIPTVNDSLNNYGDVAFMYAHDLVAWAAQQVNDYLNSEEATYTKLDDLAGRLNAYALGYAAVYNEAAEASENASDEQCADFLNELLTKQMSELTSNGLLEKAVVIEMQEELMKKLLVVEKQEYYLLHPNATDYTSFIQNAQAEAETGWTLIKGTGDKNTNKGEYYNTREPNHRYFDSYNATAGKLNFYGEQVIYGIPNGTYDIGVDARVDNNGAFIFASDADSLVADKSFWLEIPVQTYTYLSDETGEMVTVPATNKYGQIWEDACKEYEANPTHVELSYITGANAGNGYGWEHIGLKGIVVTNHIMTIGMTTDSLKSGKPFEGKWFSLTNWTLTLTEKGDNSNWNGPLSTEIALGIKEMRTDENVMLGHEDGIYDLLGRKVNAQTKPGFYIVIRNGEARKVCVK